MPSSGMLRRVARVRTNRQWLVTANVVPSSPTLVSLITDALHSSETSVLTRGTLRNIREDGILQSHRRETSKLTWNKDVSNTIGSLGVCRMIGKSFLQFTDAPNVYSY
jgi:hypothetical protein